MDIEYLRSIVENRNGMSHALGIEYISTPEEKRCHAKMNVCAKTVQPFGFLSGGASLALAENLAGLATSVLTIPRKSIEKEDYQDFKKEFKGIPVGMGVSANHFHPVKVGSYVTAEAYLKHEGHSHHVWQVDIYSPEGVLISSANVTNYVLPPSKLAEDVIKKIFDKIVAGNRKAEDILKVSSRKVDDMQKSGKRQVENA